MKNTPLNNNDNIKDLSNQLNWKIDISGERTQYLFHGFTNFQTTFGRINFTVDILSSVGKLINYLKMRGYLCKRVCFIIRARTDTLPELKHIETQMEEQNVE